jgi:dTDP-4-dehydrorhamnose reductase
MPKVIVLGSTGMLGSAVFQELSKAGLDVSEASRTKGLKFDARELESGRLIERGGLAEGDYIVNCVGLTKSRIEETSIDSRSLAVRLNVDFPNDLALAAEQKGVRVIQVATDCVFSGARGAYSESAKHDAEDVYGKTKSLGESPSEAVMHLRCSLIGPELGRNSLFFEWIRQQPEGATIQGFTNHIWNGLTSDVFGQVVSGIVTEGLFTPGVHHLVPDDKVSKDQLVRLELEALGRSDVKVSSVDAPYKIDRTLSTHNAQANLNLFAAAGYKNLPTIAQMVTRLCSELAD